MSASSICPVLDLKAGNLAEMLGVACRQFCSLCESNAGNQQIAATDVLELFVLPKLVKFSGSRRADGDDSQRGNLPVARDQLAVRALKFVTVRRLHDRSKSPHQNLNPRDDGDRKRVLFLHRPLLDAGMASIQKRQRVGIQADHSFSSSMGRPRCL
jgi:hypothetical protein